MAVRGIIGTLPLLATLTGRFPSWKERLFCFGLVVLLRDFLYWLAIAMWFQGYASEPLTMMTWHATWMFTILVLGVFFLFFYYFSKNHPWIVVFTLPFILSISIGLMHMLGVIFCESSFYI